MNNDTYHRDHWVEIGDARLEAYESMFEWHPRMAPLLEGADVAAGQTVLDFGCGPGGLSVELARRVGSTGQVHGVDLNADMITRAAARAERDSVSAHTQFHRHTDDVLPFADRTFDRVVCKSVLEYVDDPAATVAEFCRVGRAGGRVHVIDSDWGMLVAEPLSDEALAQLFDAASPAYKTPRIGRRLYGLMRGAGLEDVSVKVLSAADTVGMRAPIVRHMIGYAREFGAIEEPRLAALEATIDAAVEAGTFLLILPQFIVTGTVPR